MDNTIETTLERIRINATQHVSADLLDNQTIDVDYLPEYRLFEIRLDGYLWGKEAASFDVSYPADWWQAFKLRWFPAWLLKRYPAKMQHHHYDASVLLPEFHKRMAIPEHYGRWTHMINNQSWLDWAVEGDR